MAISHDEHQMLECALFYSLQDWQGNEKEAGEAHSRLDGDKLELRPRFSESLTISLRDIEQINAREYEIRLDIANQEMLVLTRLGYRHHDYIRTIQWLRMNAMLKDLQMKEEVLKSGFQAELEHLGPDGKTLKKSHCDLSLSETALIILPMEGYVNFVHYCFIKDVILEAKRLKVLTEYGETFIFSRPEKDFDLLRQELSEAMSRLSQQSQRTLKNSFPGIGSGVLRRMARIMKEGRSIQRETLESSDPAVRPLLANLIEKVELKESYDFLHNFFRDDQARIGIRQHPFTNEYPLVWLQMPINSPEPDRYGNTLAVEVAGNGHDTHVTCFFSLMNPKDYFLAKEQEDLDRSAEELMNLVDRSLMLTNYRLEPFYLSDEELQDPQYALYRSALKQYACLHRLRKHFVGRAFTRSRETWQTETVELLNRQMENFNEKYSQNL